MRGFLAVLRKEALQMLRDRGTLRFALLVPAFQLVLFGLIDTNVGTCRPPSSTRAARRRAAQLVDDFANTSHFDVVAYVPSRAALRDRSSPAARPSASRSRRTTPGGALNREPADFLVMIDGSDSSISAPGARGRQRRRALAFPRGARASARARRTSPSAPIRSSSSIPTRAARTCSSPGLVAILLTFSGTLLAAFAIVRERERGTLEQLMVTPASPVGVVLGKLLPYLVLGFLQLLLSSRS